MVYHDNFKYPTKGMKDIKKPQSGYMEINPDYLEEARQLILQECEDMEQYPMIQFENADLDLN